MQVKDHLLIDEHEEQVIPVSPSCRDSEKWSTMMSGEDQQHEQQEGGMVLDEDFQPPHLGNLDVSDGLSGKKNFSVPVGVQDSTVVTDRNGSDAQSVL